MLPLGKLDGFLRAEKTGRHGGLFVSSGIPGEGG
jgi:hypothetical protein